MFGVMTYNLWICVSIVGGVAIGYYLFNSSPDDEDDDNMKRSGCQIDDGPCH